MLYIFIILYSSSPFCWVPFLLFILVRCVVYDSSAHRCEGQRKRYVEILLQLSIAFETCILHYRIYLYLMHTILSHGIQQYPSTKLFWYHCQLQNVCVIRISYTMESINTVLQYTHHNRIPMMCTCLNPNRSVFIEWNMRMLILSCFNWRQSTMKHQKKMKKIGNAKQKKRTKNKKHTRT